jgi:two-component system phosphate regulon sensor histidine kinase PhoR
MMGSRPRRLIWQLYPSYLVLVLLSLLATGWYASTVMERIFISQTRDNLQHQAHLLSRQFVSLLQPLDKTRVDALCKEHGEKVPTRFTVILPNGVVVGDSQSDPSQMENHGDRPEVQAAFHGGVGYTERFSSTLRHRMLYVAVPISDLGGVLGIMRVSIATSAMDSILKHFKGRVAVGGVVIAALASLVCLVISRRISRPIETLRQGAERFARGELAHQLNPPSTLELASLAEALNRMAKDLEGRIQAVVRQRNESQAVLSSMSEGVLALDPEERVLHANQTAMGMFDTPADRITGRSIQELVRNHDLHGMVRKTLTEGLRTDGDIILYRQQNPLVLHTHCTPLLDPQGERMGALLVMNDVTQLRRLENMRRDFAANVSHEIKTPLTAIQGFVETLYHGNVENPEEVHRFLGIIHKHTNRLSAVIDDLMKLSRLEQEEQTLRLSTERTRIARMIETAVQVCAPNASEKQIVIDIGCPDSLTADMDVDLMEQAAVNLLDNAIKYSPPESSIRVTAEQQENDIVIRFEDQGIGIANKHLPRLFERFYRVDKARSRKMGGTGLGLAIVKHIVQAHGGEVDVASVQGRGSVFTIRIPAESAKA